MAAAPHLLLTRPAPASQRVLRAIEAAMKAPVPHVIAPLLEIRDLDCEVPHGAVPVLSSEHGARRAGALGLGGRAFCVGARTGAMAQAQGLRAEIAEGDSDALVALITARAPARPLVHIRGRHAAGDIAGRLRAAGFTITEAVAYDQQALPLSAAARALLQGTDPVVAPVFSPRSAALLADAVADARAPLTIVAISAQAGKPFADAQIAQTPDLAAMVQASAAALRQAAGS